MKVSKKKAIPKESLDSLADNAIESPVYLITAAPIDESTESNHNSEYKIYPIRNDGDLIAIITSDTIVSRMWIITMYRDHSKGLLATYPIHKIERCRSKITGEDLGISCFSENIGRVLEFKKSHLSEDDIEVVYTLAGFQYEE